MEKIERLYALQQIETTIAGIEDEARQSEVLRQKRQLERTITRHNKEMKGFASDLETRRKTLRKLEDQLDACQREAEEIETRLFGGDVQNPKELTSLQTNFDAMKKRRDELEEAVLDAMGAVEAAESQLLDAQAAASEFQQQLENVTNDWQQVQRNLAVKMKKARDERDALRAHVEPSLLATYDKLWERLGPRVVAQVEERTCLGCGVTLPTSTKPMVGGRCPQCDRMLWWL